MNYKAPKRELLLKYVNSNINFSGDKVSSARLLFTLIELKCFSRTSLIDELCYLIKKFFPTWRIFKLKILTHCKHPST